MEVVSYQSRPTLRRPVLVAAFAGWNDAADAATTALGFLHKAWKASEFASIDPEEFYDFQVTRPQIRLVDDEHRAVDWPKVTFSHAAMPGIDRDVVLLTGTEPSMRWRTFCDAVVDVATSTEVEAVVTLGALLAGRPHTRPIRVTGISADPELRRTLGLGSSRYEGPTGIVGVLHDACHRADIPSVSLWAWVPHYLRETPSPPAALGLLRRLQELLDFELDAGNLEDAASTYDAQVADAIASDPEFAAQVTELEQQSDSEDLADLPSGEQIAAELERYLRDQRPDG